MTDAAGRCSICGSATGPFTKVEGLFTVLMCADCQATRGHGAGPYPVMTRAEMRESLELLPSPPAVDRDVHGPALACR